MLNELELNTVDDVHDFVHEVNHTDDLTAEEEGPRAQPPDVEGLGLVPPSGPTSHLRPLLDWQSLLFAPGGDLVAAVSKGVEAIQRLMSAGMSVAMRPGHQPPDGVCPRCGEQIPKSITRNQNRKYASHVHDCESHHVIDSALPTLLARYPTQGIQYFQPTGPWGNAFKQKVKNVYQIVTSITKRRRQIRCTCLEEFWSYRLYMEHMVVVHDVYLPRPPGTSEKAKLQKAVADGNWGQSEARFQAVYHHFDEKYHVDPKELQLFARYLLNTLFGEPAGAVSAFRVRRDLTSISRPSPDAEPDNRNQLRPINEGGRCDAFCIVCATDPYADSLQEWHPCPSFSWFNAHTCSYTFALSALRVECTESTSKS